MKLRTCTFIVAVAATGMPLITAGPALAALFLVFDAEHTSGNRSTAITQPGERLRARTGGSGAMGSIEEMRIFYAPAPASYPDSVASLAELRALRGLLFLGRLVADEQGTGHITFSAPDVPGRYQLVAYCPRCADFSAGRNVLPVGELRVANSALPTTGAMASVVVAGSFILLGLGLLLLLRIPAPGARESVPG